MTLPTSIHAFADIPLVLEPCLAAGGGRYRFDSVTKATTWRARAYRYRKLLQAQAARAAGGEPVPTPYDSMRLTIEGSTVVINFDIKLQGQLSLANGREAPTIPKRLPPVPMPSLGRSTTTPTPADSEILSAALNLGFLKGVDDDEPTG